jgi:hypothetical protein
MGRECSPREVNLNNTKCWFVGFMTNSQIEVQLNTSTRNNISLRNESQSPNVDTVSSQALPYSPIFSTKFSIWVLILASVENTEKNYFYEVL